MCKVRSHICLKQQLVWSSSSNSGNEFLLQNVVLLSNDLIITRKRLHFQGKRKCGSEVTCDNFVKLKVVEDPITTNSPKTHVLS